jgi:hypothetical protein
MLEAWGPARRDAPHPRVRTQPVSLPLDTITMHAANPSAEIAILTLSWVNEHLRLQAARQQLDAWVDRSPPTWQRPLLLLALVWGLCGVGLVTIGLCA